MLLCGQANKDIYLNLYFRWQRCTVHKKNLTFTFTFFSVCYKPAIVSSFLRINKKFELRQRLAISESQP